MPCQCGTTEALTADPEAGAGGCACGSGAGSDAGAGCACGSGASSPSTQEVSLERVVMELDRRVRALEAGR